MSVENARFFLHLLASQPEVKDQLYVAAPADARDLLGFAAQKGYVFSEADLQEALSTSSDHSLVEQLTEILEA